MSYIKFYLLSVLLLVGSLAANGQFITTWKTDNPGKSNTDQIEIPTFSGETYNYNVDWGDGNTDTGVTGNITHTYAAPGTYTVTITGTFPRIYFNGDSFFGDNTDFEKILTIEQWGANPWTSMASAFSGCINLAINATDAPDLSGVTDLSYMFRGCTSLNDNIDSWNVGTVTNMTGLFRGATAFNQPLGSWNVSAATNMSEMFLFAAGFNQDISGWNVSSVTNMGKMFSFASAFNQNIGSWVVTNVTNMDQMFSGAAAFNQDISGWDVSNVTFMRSMFNNATAFNQNISTWNISSITDMRNFFKGAASFNQDLSAWNVLVGNITNMNSMFAGATSFNQNLSGWDVSSVTDMGSMFANTTYNQDITAWNVSSVSNFNGMFENNTAFNQNISGTNWDIANATDLRNMFRGATAFDQDLSDWDISSTTSMTNMFNNSGLSVTNYDNILIGWSSSGFAQPNVNFGASGIFYCQGETARNTLTSAPNNWFISDAGPGCIETFEGANTSGQQVFNNQVTPVDFGSGPLSIGKTRNITIANKLITDLTNFDVSITGTDFSVTAPALPAIINGGTNLTLDITLSGAATGTFTATVTLTSPEMPTPFTFPITGTITTNAEPEIKVFAGPLPQGTSITDGDVAGYDIGIVNRGTNSTNQITILNNGSAPLVVSSLSVSGSAFSLSQTAGFTLPVDNSQVITITLDGSLGGSFSETLNIISDDVDEATFDFVVVGNVLGPDIDVFDGTDIYNDPEVFNGQATPIDFGTGQQGTNITRKLTIANRGPVDLAISSIVISDTIYSIVPSGPVVIAAVVDGVVSTLSFDLTLNGAIAGTFNETVTITSDDDLDPAFVFNLTGTINDPNAPKMYWSEGTGRQINRSNLDGTAYEQYHAEAIFTPRGIGIDTLNNTVYWTNNYGQIKKGDIAATGLINVADFINDGLDQPREWLGLALDVAGGKIYWADKFNGAVKVADLGAANPITTIQTIIAAPDPIGVAVDPANNKLYYTANFNNGGLDDNIASLHQVNLDGTGDVVLMSEQITGEQYTYNDVKLDPVNNIIYWSSSNADEFNPIGKIYAADISNVTGTVTSFTTPNNNPKGIDLDLKGGRIYWVDSTVYMQEPQIASALLDGTGQTTLHLGYTNINEVMFIALDVPPLAITCSAPPTATAGADQTICEGNTLALSGTTGGSASTGTWTTSGDGSFDDAASLTAIYTPGTTDISNGSATLTLTTDDPDGPGPCVAAVSQLVLTINASATAIAGADQTICEGDALTLSGTIGGGATTSTWTTSGDGSFDDATSLTAIYTPGTTDISNGSATLTLTTDDPDGAGACVAAVSQLTLTIEAAPTVDAGADQNICPADAASLSGTIGGSATAATWSTAGDGSFDNTASLTASYTPGTADIAAATVTLTLTTTATAACPAVSDQLILAINQPITAADQTGSLNVNETITIDVTNGSTLNTGDVLTTTLLSPPQKGDATVNADGSIAYTALPGNVGADSFDYQICNQCNLCSTAQATITILNTPPAAQVDPASTTAGQPVTVNVLAGISDINGNIDLSSLKIIIQPISGASAYFDSDGNLIVDYTGISFVGTDEITVEVCDTDGVCISFVVYIEVLAGDVEVFNALSPNGDGRHDYLEIANIEFYPDNTVKILNRWGDIVFTTTGYDNNSNRFEGVANKGGKGELPPGTYFYNIVLEQGGTEINGFFELRR